MAASVLVLPHALSTNLTVLNEDQSAMAEQLISLGQDHLFEHWPAPGTDDDLKRKLCDQCITLDQQYQGGIGNYVTKAKALLADSLAGKNPFDGWIPSVPSGEVVNFDTDKFMELEALAMENLNGLGFVLLAGGLGERLGYSGIKLELPNNLITSTCYLQLYIENILALQARARIINNDDSIIFPLALMVSGDTEAKTRDLMTRENNFGMVEEQVFWLKQEKVPALIDNEARFAFEGYEVVTKPHGHGDIHSLMYSTGTAQAWLENFGTQWTLFFQDTNGVVFRSYVAALGVCKQYNFAMNSVTIPRLPGQAVGGIALLENEDGRSMTINVEYNQLGPLLLNTGDCKGDVANETGFSPYPGNVNSFILDHPLYCEILEASEGVIPEFVNPKYTDATKTVFKKPTRLECMMQDYPKLLANTNREVGITQADGWLVFNPVKNNVKDAKTKYEKVGAADSGCTGEANMYYTYREYVRACGVPLEETENNVFEGIPCRNGAKVVLKPSFGVTLNETKQRLVGGSDIVISPESSLVLDGDITIEKLNLHGSLKIIAAPGVTVRIEELTVDNAPREFVPIDVTDQSIDEIYRIRGYTLNDETELVLSFTEDTVVNDKTKGKFKSMTGLMVASMVGFVASNLWKS